MVLDRRSAEAKLMQTHICLPTFWTSHPVYPTPGVCKNSVPQGPDDNASKVQPFPPPTAPYEQAYPPPGQVPVALAVAPGWEARQDPSGRTYYQNNVTQQTSWEPPPMQ